MKFHSIALAVLLCTASIQIQAQEFDGGYRGQHIIKLKTPRKAINFLVVGDWGRSGEYFQKETAVQLGRASHDLDADWIVSTGDNFYPKGVISVNDPIWKRSFEDIYSAHALMINWYPVLGNHDYAGDPQAEIDYTKVSRRWNLPARYHSFEKVSDDGVKVLFVFMDTSPFEKKYYKDEEEPFRTNIQTQDTTAQKIWLRKTLASSDATWKFVFGHHPLHSAGPRNGLTKDVAASFLPDFENGGVDVYMAGHEHSLQHIQLGAKLHQFVSGAGSEVTPVKDDGKSKFARSAHGFYTVSINKDGALFQAVDHEGKILYETLLKR
ncbi:MAG: metallophosphoesterase [Chitinophagia bacterium]|jgi:tartrate-resistant acid phosphatase type 5